MGLRGVKWLGTLGLCLLTILLIAAGAAWRIGLVSVPHETGYFAPIFAPDGKSVFTIRREARALVTGPGVEFFTPPATVRLQRDRFDLLNITLPDARVTVVETCPPSPLEGSSIRAYHGAIFGVPHAHLRWADAAHLEVRGRGHPPRYAAGAHLRHSQGLERYDRNIRDDHTLAGNTGRHVR